MDTGTLVVGLLVGIVGVVIAGYWRANAGAGGATTTRDQGSGAIETLKERYVDGDIDAVEFEKRLETLYEDDTTGEGAATAQTESDPSTTAGQTSTVERTDRQPSDERSSRRTRTTCGPGRKSRRRSKKRGCR